MALEMTFHATKAAVSNRGSAPDSFLSELVTCAKVWPQEVCAVNATAHDVFDVVRPILGPWVSILHRCASMCEVLRVLGGMESSWNWEEGVDTSNASSVAHLSGQEAGIFQVSFDSLALDSGHSLKNCLNDWGVETEVHEFIAAMRSNHALAIGYAARLLRVNTAWSGPTVGGHMQPWLSRAAVAEFEQMLAS